MRTIKYTANDTFVAPPHVTKVLVQAWGGGGGGSNVIADGGGGGGGGAYS